MDTVVIYPGRFHPFHKGHKSVYDTLVKRFGKDRVYIATSNKVDPPKSPFTFDEKRAMMALTGVDPSRVVQVKNPYQATEITDNYDPQNTIALFAVSDKDMAEDPRFSFKPRKDGQPSYYQPAQKEMAGFDKHAYIVTIPTLQFNVLGEPMRSATEFRANFARADDEKQKSMITDLFGRYDPNVHKTMAQKIVEQLQRADEILDKLIELGADDEYIVEACARVDMLKNKILKENRRQSLYQAIMEGGHSLPETAVAQEEITDFNKQDPMNSVIAIRGIGTMSISSALDKVGEMAKDIAKLGAMKNAKDVQDNLPRYIDLLATYSNSIQEAYRELAAQRKRGGTASKGIDKDITEDKKPWFKDGVPMCSKECCGTPVMECTCPPTCEHCNCHELKKMMEGYITATPANPLPKRKVKEIDGKNNLDLDLDDVNPKFKNILRTAIVKYPFAKDSMDAVLHMMMDQLKKDDNQNKEIGRLDKENDQQDTEIDQIEKDVNNLTFAREDSDRWDRFFSKGKYKDLFGDDDDWIKDIQPVTGGRRKGKQPPLDFDPFGDVNEHCGDPMADDHKPVRMLLMKLYQKEMQCVPGSPEHFEVMQMIDGCRKNIGLDEGIVDTVTDYIKKTIKKRKDTLSGKSNVA